MRETSEPCRLTQLLECFGVLRLVERTVYFHFIAACGLAHPTICIVAMAAMMLCATLMEGMTFGILTASTAQCARSYVKAGTFENFV